MSIVYGPTLAPIARLSAPDNTVAAVSPLTKPLAV